MGNTLATKTEVANLRNDLVNYATKTELTNLASKNDVTNSIKQNSLWCADGTFCKIPPNKSFVLGDQAIQLRGDTDKNHMIMFDGSVDGPIITGFAGGKLSVTNPAIDASKRDILRWTSDGTVFVNKICSTIAPYRCIDLNFQNGINFTNINGGQLRFQDDANVVQYTKTGQANLALNKLDGNYGN